MIGTSPAPAHIIISAESGARSDPRPEAETATCRSEKIIVLPNADAYVLLYLLHVVVPCTIQNEKSSASVVGKKIKEYNFLRPMQPKKFYC